MENFQFIPTLHIIWIFCIVSGHFPKYPEILQQIMSLLQKLSGFAKTFRSALLTRWRGFSDSGQTIQNRTTQYSQLRPRYAQCMIQTATSSSICPPTPGSPSAQFCTEHKLPFLHTAAGKHSVCNLTRIKYPRRWCPRPRLQLAGSTLPHALEPASTCTTCTNLSLQGTLAWTSFKLWRTLEHYLGVFKSKSTSKSKSQGSYIYTKTCNYKL